MLACSTALLQASVFVWTGNRVVSVITACLFGLQPLALSVWSGPEALESAGALLFSLASLRLHTEALRLRSAGVAGHQVELSALLCVGAGAWLSPFALALPTLWLLTEAVFQGGAPTRRGWVLAVGGLGLALWAGAQSPANPEQVVGSLAALATAAGAPLSELETHAGLLTGIVIGAGVLALCAGLWRRAAHPRWLLLHTAFGLGWLAVMTLVALPAGKLSPLAAIGPCFLLPAWAWRVLLLTPPGRSEAARRGSGADGMASAAPLVQAWREPAAPAVVNVAPQPMEMPADEPVASAAQIRTRVEAAVAAAVETSVASLLSAVAEQRGVPRPAAANAQRDAARERWMEDTRRTAAGALVAADVQANLREGVFATLLQPFLGQGVRVLEIAPSVYTSMLAGACGELVCVDTSPLVLEQARRGLPAGARALLVLGEGSATAALPDASFDLVFSAEALVWSDAARSFRLLLEVQRVLRSGGVAVLGFTNLSEALGRRAFVASALSAGQTRSGPMQSMTVETLRICAAEAGLDVDSVHLSIAGPSSHALLRKTVHAERSHCGQ